ncbi:hypothetical protein FRC11_001833, partial [Ceratobasidium sp. 423]
DASAHRTAAESAQASTVAIEGQLKPKKQDLEAIWTKLQSCQLPQTCAVGNSDSTSLLQNKITEQEDTIKSLKLQVLNLEKSTETHVECYKANELKENKVKLNKPTLTNLGDSLVMQIKQPSELEVQFGSNQAKGPAG